MREVPSRIPQYKVSIWETVAIVLGAIATLGVGLTGLALKFLSNAATPQRAEAIASNIMGYSLPGASQGLLGVNLAGAKVALIASEGDEPDIQLLVARVPIEQESGRKQVDRILDSIALGADEEELKIKSVRVENKNLCGTSTSVVIREGQLKYPDSPEQATVIYRASVNLEDSRYVVNLLTNGQDLKTAAEKASTVFDSLQCKQ
ncbi:MAG: hypothetical protein J0L70_08780 [Leptolyngbya sp. UWPOB_LEPTO1]|uniref:hypothetical protein n=1 Tax=Leptolyngbya sp. UWPOB_LEPTO1 TaxID=2815653 RepID=UPI001AC0CC64|nr:hypothetical protein [Leptolyngbya sp. UWPOB_LEPTO1]MBN8560602.1 hypothetical protein [Leptolyngbya sp. UWPOB_LEPTO1]